MKFAASIAFVTCLAVALSGCGPSQEELDDQKWEKMVEELNEMSESLLEKCADASPAALKDFQRVGICP